ncbi:hypothetical protein HMN09_00383400 [Mycena chlorophos]|uniref:Malate dehydrogenase n=1 Tax=Mycena chlorophos TaxID=658473 RepID=A0A8H6TN44_MYCCL|nr:hypothetical protein HMN09_00383400 [Mycena chlorophos]
MVSPALPLALLALTAGATAQGTTGSITTPRCLELMPLVQGKMPVPPNQNSIVVPASVPSYIGLGIGIQNYTCTGGNYTNVGAVAELFDVSCLIGTPEFSSLQDIGYAAWSQAPTSFAGQGTIQALIAALSPYHASFVLGQHYFIPAASGSGITAVWDFRASFPGNDDALVLGSKVGDVPAPTGPPDVDWLSLNGMPGHDGLATQIFRVSSVGGLPPAQSCTPGSPEITVKYSSMYWLFGTSVGPNRPAA